MVESAVQMRPEGHKEVSLIGSFPLPQVCSESFVEDRTEEPT